MKHRVSKLEGALLDAAVALAEGWTYHEVKAMILHGPDGPDAIRYLAASTCWGLGGPIIERERILTWPTIITYTPDGLDPLETPIKQWAAMHPQSKRRGGGLRGVFFESGTVDVEATSGMPGPTPLIAAMRAYVTSKFGEEVDLEN